MNYLRIGLAALLIAAPVGIQAQTVPAEEPALNGAAVGVDLFHSSDADETEVTRLGFDFDIINTGPDRYRGVRIERARYNPVGQGWEDRTRFFLRAADRIGDDYKWNAAVGSDGHTVVGNAAIHDEAKFRKELFVERDILETPSDCGADFTTLS